MSEIQFVQGMAARRIGDCHGPLVTLMFGGFALASLEDSLRCTDVVDFLWDRFLPEHNGDRPAFAICTGHWLDMCAYIMVQGRADGNEERAGLAVALLKDTCRGVGWDPKELSNLFCWRRVSLT